MRVIEALAAIRSSRFDLPLTYDCHDLDVRVGDVVRAPLGSRDVVAFVVSAPHDVPHNAKVKRIIERCDVPRAFDETGLHLAHFVAERYVCTLGEALGAVVLSAALPRVHEVLERSAERPEPSHVPSVPQRLLDVMWNDLPQAFGIETLLRHPEARRAGDRAALLRAVQALVNSGAVKRVRRFDAPKTQRYIIRVLTIAGDPPSGKKAQALFAFVNERPGVPRADALLAGFPQSTIARAIRTGAIAERTIEPSRTRARGVGAIFPEPTAEQRVALERIVEAIDLRQQRAFLLFGVTGSGKTYVYLRAIERVVAAGGRAIVLVPEISLTPQTARAFEDVFGERVAVLHSALSDRERFEAWQAAMHGDVDVVVGARSAVFAPLPDVRLIVVDEAHETSYKQEIVPRYGAVAVARERMRAAGGTIVLGSATPSLESWHAAQSGALELLTLRERATAQAMPAVRVVDMSEEFASGNRRAFGSALSQALADRLERGEKSVLFVNRRGSGGFLLCRSCGYVAQCDRCSVSLAVHRSERLLRCHYCDLQRAIPTTCPTCGEASIKEFGIGTEAVAEEVLRLFPTARVVRMDSDTTTRVGDHARLLAEFESNADVLVGTQMVAKGLDFPTVTLAGVVAADIGLHVSDFRASERTFGLVTQVCGRSGRARPGEAIVQTYAPTHPAIVHAAAHDYEGFALEELAERAALGYPPARRLAYLGVIGRDRAHVERAIGTYAEILKANVGIDVLGPAPYPIARLNHDWRYRIMLRTSNARALRDAIRSHVLPLARADRATRIAISIDP